MLNRIDGFWLAALASSSFGQDFTLGPLPPGTNVYANISLSLLNTLFAGNNPDPEYAATAFVASWTVYQPDGTQSEPQTGSGFTQNAVSVQNCATIKFTLFVERAWAIAQVNVFTF